MCESWVLVAKFMRTKCFPGQPQKEARRGAEGEGAAEPIGLETTRLLYLKDSEVKSLKKGCDRENGAKKAIITYKQQWLRDEIKRIKAVKMACGRQSWKTNKQGFFCK